MASFGMFAASEKHCSIHQFLNLWVVGLAIGWVVWSTAGVVGRIMFSPEMMKTAQSMMANMSPEELLAPLAEICAQRGDNLNKIFGEKRT